MKHSLVDGTEYLDQPDLVYRRAKWNLCWNLSEEPDRWSGYQAIDFSVFKTGTIHETVKVQFRAEFFNLFNHYNFAPPSNTADGQSLGLIYDTIGDYNGAPGIGPRRAFQHATRTEGTFLAPTA